MCNTRSKVYLQSIKTYILSVNTLTWNLTSERHDNCAPCLGLILPIRWATPPPNSSFRSVFLMTLLLQIFALGLTSILICFLDYLHNVDLVYAYIKCSILCSIHLY